MYSKRLEAYNLNMLRTDYPIEETFGFPITVATQSVPKKMISFNRIMSATKHDKDAFVHFYIDDYQFERIWKSPQRYVQLLKKYAGIVAPDFSLYHTMPRAMQIWNVYRNRWLSAYYSSCGIDVIPSANWNYAENYDFAFAGLPKESTIAFSTVGGMKHKECIWMQAAGMHEMIRQLKPTMLCIYGTFPDTWEKHIPKNIAVVKYSSFTTERKRSNMYG